MHERESILVTGATSMLLRSLVDRIDRLRCEVFSISRKPPGEQTWDSVRFLQGNIQDRDFVIQCCKGIDTIIHGAALTHAVDQRAYMAVNVSGTENLVDGAVEHGVKDFIFVSSRTAGYTGGAYSLSKKKGEEYVQARLGNWLILRPAEVFGTESAEGVDKIVADVRARRLILCPVGLNSRLFPIWYQDVVDAMYSSIFVDRIRNEVVTINGEEGFTYKELVEHLATIIDKRIVVLPIPRAILFAIKKLVEVTGMNIGFVPDQVPRLYSEKSHGSELKTTLRIGDYFQQIQAGGKLAK